MQLHAPSCTNLITSSSRAYVPVGYPVTAKLSREFKDRFGGKVVDELVERFNNMDEAFRIFGVAAVLTLPMGMSAQIPDTTIALQDDFSNPDLGDRWSYQRLANRHTAYRIIDGALEATARSSASALVRRVDVPAEHAVIRWRWMIKQGLWQNRKEMTRGGDDYAARVFVIFGDRLGERDTRALCYVWAAHEPSGSRFPSPYTEQVRMIVLQSGPGLAESWVSEERRIISDYLAAFGEPPRANVGGVALMVDADNTRLEARAVFDDIAIVTIEP